MGASTASEASTSCDFDLLVVPPDPVDFDRDIQPIFDERCVACHQPGAEGHAATGLDLRPGQSHRHLDRVRSAQNPDQLLVVPFDSDIHRNLLWRKVHCDDPGVGERMPKGGPNLTLAEQIDLYAWLSRGAPPGLDGSRHSLPIQPGLGGSWYDPSAAGQGFIIETVATEPPMLIAYWLTFESLDFWREAVQQGNHRPQFGQRWMVAVGDHAEGDSDVELEIRFFVGAWFDRVYAPDMHASGGALLGRARLMFHACDEATLHYDIRLDDDPQQPLRRGIALRRLTPNVLCEENDHEVRR